MGKKGSWLTALKKAFTPGPKERPTNVQLVAQYPQEHRSAREKKRWGFGRSRQLADPSPAAALINMNIPLYREPSSIEKILGDAEMERQYFGRPAQYQIIPAKPATLTGPPPAALPPPPAAAARERERVDVVDEKPALALPLPPPSPPPLIRRFDHDREHQQHQAQQSRAETEWRRQPPPSRATRAARRRAVPPDRARAAAVAIQAAFRGHVARRSYRSLRGLIRLQAVVRGPSVRRQTAHAMRCMQTLVRVQAQVRASRVEAMERRNGHAAMLRNGGGRWRAGAQDGGGGGIWEDSLLSRDEMDARTRRKVEAVVKRERALAYAYSHQVLKATPMAAHAILADLQSGRSPWWWTPIERRHEPIIARPKVIAVAHRETPAAATPARSVVSSYAAKPRAAAKGLGSGHGGGCGGGGSCSIRDDESLTSCPAFGVGGMGVPNYMTPTVSASAKARARAAARAHVLQQQAAAEQQKPRFSFGLGQSIGSWAKSPFWKAAGGGGGGQSQASSRVGTPAASVAGGGRHRPTRSISGLSVDSVVSMPAGLGRRPFK